MKLVLQGHLMTSNKFVKFQSNNLWFVRKGIACKLQPTFLSLKMGLIQSKSDAELWDLSYKVI